MYKKPYLDSCVYIAAIKGPKSNEPAGHPETAIQILTDAQKGTFLLHASTWLAAEIIRPGHGNAPFNPKVDAKIDGFLNTAVTWTELDLPTALKARVLSREHHLKPADAVHLATAIRLGCDEFLTWNTGDFPPDKTVEGVTFKEPYWFGQQTAGI